MGAETEAERDVLGQLARILDPDLGTDIVSCGFVKELSVDEGTGAVSFALELTTPACPVKDSVSRPLSALCQCKPTTLRRRVSHDAGLSCQGLYNNRLRCLLPLQAYRRSMPCDAAFSSTVAVGPCSSPVTWDLCVLSQALTSLRVENGDLVHVCVAHCVAV